MENAPQVVNNGLHSVQDDGAATAAPRDRRIKDSAATRARILEAAQTIFANESYTHAGLREIAAAADVNVALVARYFGSKEGLFEAALDGLLSERTLWAHARETFGRSVVASFVDGESDYQNPLHLLMQASTDPVSKAVALRVIETRVLTPLAEWLGGPRAIERAAAILAVCAGFFTYRIMIPMDCFLGPMEAGSRVWLETALQQIVDSN